ncbi:venom allergen 3-like [Spodoptera frugiperda]|uniref:Venom allergen 3-like n=1 Tax=Spodoptera frugiperda TaxID=7108 RepID=A0A9R0ECU2_SPOFR|nr:venom allergen 3-like [Spodoptera frugiperda]
MFGVVVVLSCVLALAATGSIDYCGAAMCGGKNTHTYCQYPEGPGPKCIEYENAKLRNREKVRILKRLNSARNKAAAGALNFPPAANMMKLHWVEELAREAQRWADQCVPPRRVELHDTCRDLYSLTVGQCVASVIGRTPERVDYMVDIWNKQTKYYNHSITKYEPPMNDSKYYYGDFAQLYWAKSYMVGCARSRFKTPLKGTLKTVERLVCNVAPAGPKRHRRLWHPYAPAELCPYRAARANSWGNLCDYPNTATDLQQALAYNERVLSKYKGKKKNNKKVLFRIPGSKSRAKRAKENDDEQLSDDGGDKPENNNIAGQVRPSIVMVLALFIIV